MPGLGAGIAQEDNRQWRVNYFPYSNGHQRHNAMIGPETANLRERTNRGDAVHPTDRRAGFADAHGWEEPADLSGGGRR